MLKKKTCVHFKRLAYFTSSVRKGLCESTHFELKPNAKREVAGEEEEPSEARKNMCARFIAEKNLVCNDKKRGKQ